MPKTIKAPRSLLALAVIVLVLMVGFQPPRDLDLGWHLRYGEYISQHRWVMRDNVISFLWPDYRFLQSSWGYDVLLYQLFSRAGFLGISLVGAIVTATIFILLAQPLKRHPFHLLILASVYLSQSALVFNASLRAQSISALLFALVLVYADRAYVTRSSVWVLVPLFLLWANVHGGFLLGLFLVTLRWFIHGTLSGYPSSWRYYGAGLAASTAVTLVNPYGAGLWQEALGHLWTNPNFAVIREWMPLASYAGRNVVSALLVIFVVIAVSHFHGKQRYLQTSSYVGIFMVAALLTFRSVRFSIVFGMMATHFLANYLPAVITRRIPRVLGDALGIILVAAIAFDMSKTNFFILPVQTKPFSFGWQEYCTNWRGLANCSEEITKIMRADPPAGPGYNTYNYGGYLSWRVPQVKTFIDGRMTAWQRNGEVVPISQSDLVTREAVPLSWWQLNNQYDFQWAIVPTQSPIAAYLNRIALFGRWQRVWADDHWSYFVKQGK